ncbi:MAG: 30S ribosomal protein S27ae [Candidatus Hodarchaeales archaeon]|jgi:small subunit ribosomal protein S27Ae
MPKIKQNTLYDIDYKKGTIKRKLQFCPRCSGIFLASHKNRRSCGSCGYTEYLKKK